MPGVGALPIQLFVLNPLWGFNRKLMDKKELINLIGEGPPTTRLPSFYSRASGLLQIPGNH